MAELHASSQLRAYELHANSKLHGSLQLGFSEISEGFAEVGEAYVKKTSQIDNASIWHARSGHVGYQLLQQISSKGLVDGMPTLKNVCEDVICQGCQYGKSHRLPFKNSSNQRSEMFELVHTDLMGPIKTKLLWAAICYGVGG
ncbi:Retrovirus-related Pol polyprotein from transposon TNT 1-94 [Senna tora]|uniref:Retrovirus-related Pol polyprotein from transposon TNT 1-94 n=1 Tax=Senna tora TaxID=362788 RepID=A0A834X933_9FABA|nr:Retrovirus-related Pol polyprotein from transposon TNT 1-94 [Senna tora]